MGKLMTKQDFISKLAAAKRNDIVLLGDYINSATKTLFKCTKKTCGHEWHARPNNILTKHQGCPVCAGKKLIRDVNSAAVLRPDLIKYFVNPEDAYNVRPGSHKEVLLKCPECGSQKKMRMDRLYIQGFSCTECSDHISYPNRFIRSIMNQLRPELECLEYEWSDKWTNRRLYDAYFEYHGDKYVIEMQGLQHYMQTGWEEYKSLEEVRSIDCEKLNIAMQHDITPIIIDARESDFDFIFSNVENSLLGKLFDLSVIDKHKSMIDITSSFIKQVCEKYKNDKAGVIKELSNEFNLSEATITKYLKIGSKIGWCDYVPGTLNTTQVQVLNLKGDVLFCFDSIAACVRELGKIYNINFDSALISRACQKGYTHHGFYFKYI